MNLSKSWGLQIESGVFKFLKKITRKDAEVLLAVIHALPQNPFWGDVQKIKGVESIWRRRVGAYRIFFELMFDERVILVSRVERRSSKTY